MPKKATTEDLASMMAKGFDDLQGGIEDTKEEIHNIKDKLEDIDLKFDKVVYKFEVKDLQRRVDVLENWS